MAECPETQVDPWQFLNRFTQARIGLGRAGISLPTHVQLKFNADHAMARDAVLVPLDVHKVKAEMEARNIFVQCVHSQVADRSEYLQRPDLGRLLNSQSRDSLIDNAAEQSPDVAIALVDGLSSTAVQQNGSRLVISLVTAFKQAGLTCSPVCIVEQGRVAIGDDIGECINAKSVVLIVGERPGLSSPDSLGIYFTFDPKVGRNDANRNCISNIRAAGLSIEAATQRCLWLVEEAARLKLSGVNLKDKSEGEANSLDTSNQQNFLLPASK